MKPIRTLLVALALMPTALPTLTQASTPTYAEKDTSKLVEAANALAYRALQVTDEARRINSYDSHPNLSKAIRLSQQIRWRALDIADRLQNGDGSVLDLLRNTEPLVLQLQSTKAPLQSSHRDEQDLQKDLSDVRRNYFYLKQLLTGKT